MKTASILVDRNVLIQALQSSVHHRFTLSADYTSGDKKKLRDTLDIDSMSITGGRVKLTITTAEEVANATVEPAKSGVGD